MQKMVIYTLLSIGMGVGGYIPIIFGASGIGGWSIIGSALGGFTAVYIISKLPR